MSAVIRVRNLSRDFREVRAVDDLSFTVPAGEVYGFLGQNGAGKSTTIRMLLSLIRPTAGRIEIFDLDLERHRHKIMRSVGAIIEKPDLYKFLTALENLRIFSAMSGNRHSEKQLLHQLELVGLRERAHSKVQTYSQGMKQRLGIAVALVHDPDLIILDEPMNGLDPQGIADVRKLIVHLAHDRGKTVFVSSHLLNEMELIADSMLIINKGKKIAEGSKEELLNPTTAVVEVITGDASRATALVHQSRWSAFALPAGEGALRFELEKARIPELTKELVEMGIPIHSIRPRHSLEDLFLSLTAH
ncbi:MAG TPA: ABC transporter ATP-binding protein [Chitinophagaceae bacterium]|nr:ABC transporter ATP-binding protein [Chitinophagaceae bacterium]